MRLSGALTGATVLLERGAAQFGRASAAGRSRASTLVGHGAGARGRPTSSRRPRPRRGRPRLRHRLLVRVVRPARREPGRPRRLRGPARDRARAAGRARDRVPAGHASAEAPPFEGLVVRPRRSPSTARRSGATPRLDPAGLPAPAPRRPADPPLQLRSRLAMLTAPADDSRRRDAPAPAVRPSRIDWPSRTLRATSIPHGGRSGCCARPGPSSRRSTAACPGGGPRRGPLLVRRRWARDSPCEEVLGGTPKRTRPD